MSDNDIIPFDLPTEEKKIIKVIGVGGGGGNAVKNMYRTGIQDVSFVLCNTDNQALAKSEIPVKLQIGRNTTKGLGAGNDPEVARQAAEENIEDIRKQFNDGTEMVFITAGMGGGTGTGAAPVVAREAKESGVLTVGVVTIPFKFELRPKIVQALKGVDAISKHVDALLVINNERIFDIYQNRSIVDAFHRVDYRLGIAPTRAAARQLVSHRHITVNGNVVNIPSYSLKAGDVVAVREKSKTLETITESLAGHRANQYAWLEWNAETLSGKFLQRPEREDIPENIKEQLIVELYSK